jgi:hypothetical protein
MAGNILSYPMLDFTECESYLRDSGVKGNGKPEKKRKKEANYL